MASFVEQATLKVNDQSSAQIKKINAALKELNKTARSLKNVNVNININTGDINKAVDAVKRLKTELKGLKSVKPNITAKSTGIKASATAVKNLTRQMRDLRSTAGAIKMNVKMDSLKKAYGRLRTFQNAAKNAINVHATVPPQGASQGAPRQPRQPRAPRAAAPPPAPRSRLSRFAAGAAAPVAAIGGGIAHAIKEGVKGIGVTIGYEIAHTLGHEMVKGTAQAAIANTSLELRQLSPAEHAKALAEVGGVAAEQRRTQGGAEFIPRAEVQKLISESIAITAGSSEEAANLVKMAIPIARTGFSQGQTKEESESGMMDIIKVGEQKGAFFKPGTAEFDPKRAQEFFDTVQRMQTFMGSQFTGQKFRSVMQSSGVAKYSMSNDTMKIMGLLEQESGSRIGTGINTMIKNLTGDVLTKKKVGNLSKMGLLNKEQSEAGKVGDKSLTEIIGTGATDEKGLRTDMLAWIRDTLTPKLQKQGVSLTDKDQIVKAVSGITSGKGSDALATLIIQMHSLEKDLKRMNDLDLSKVDPTLNKDPRVAVDAAQASVESALGQLGIKAAPIIVPAMQKASEELGKVAENLATGKVTAGDVVKTLALGGAGVVGLGAASGLMAMTSSDPAVRALGAAGTELQVAAAELSAAAALQSFGMKGILGRLGIALAPAAGALGLATVVSGGLPGADVPPELDTEAGRKKAEERSLAQYQLYVAKQQLAQIEANKKDVKRGDLSGNLSPRSGGQQIVPYAQAVSELNAKIAALSSSVDKLGGSSVLAPEMGGKNWIQQAVAAGVAAGMANKPPQWGDVPGATPKTKVPLPKPRPDVLDKSTSDNIVGAANTIQTSVSGFSSNFLAATSKLDGSASTFAGVFETGTQQFIAAGGQAGQQAVSAMSGGAAGIGNVIGTTAAAAMRAAVANLSINVNANVVGANNATADKGGSKSD